MPWSITPLYSHDLNQPSVADIAPMGLAPLPSTPTNHALCLIGWHPQLILVPGVLWSWETSFFPHHMAPLGFPRALPPSNPSWEDAHLWESFFSSWPHSFPALPGIPSPSITSCRMPICGKSSPQLFPLPGVHSGLLQLPLNLLPLCMHLFIANIFDLSNVLSKKMGMKIQKNTVR